MRVATQWSWSRLCGVLAPHDVRGRPVDRVRGVCLDSRVVRSGDLFFALPGRETDGHRFVAAAASQGAAAAVVTRPPEPQPPPGWPYLLVDDAVSALGRLARAHLQELDVPVVAVTGSVGKTTTKQLVSTVLGQTRHVYRAPGNWNTELGVPLAVLTAQPAHDVLVLEFSMTGRGEIARLTQIAPPDVGVVTRVAESHLEQLTTMAQVAQAKAELVEALPPEGWAVLNADDPRVAAIKEQTMAQICWYGLELPEGSRAAAHDAALTVYADQLEAGLDGSRFQLHLPGETGSCRLPLPGRFNVSNALAAAAVGVVLGLTGRQIRQGLAQARPLPMRVEIHDVEGGLRIIDDTYNASPTSTVAALEILAAQAGRRRIAILADMLELGPVEAAGHRQVGREAARLGIEVLVAVGQRMTEAVQAFQEAAPERQVEWVEDVERLLPRLAAWIRPEDAVLVKGSRGMTMERAVEALKKR